MKGLIWLGILLLIFAYSMLWGVVFADLWRMAFVPAGLPPITAAQAIIGSLALGLLAKPKRDDKPVSEMAVEAIARAVSVLVTWGAAYLLAWAFQAVQP